LKAWAANRGDSLSQKDWWSVKAKAETRGITLAELADLAEKNNGDWNSSAAGLRWLINNYHAKATDAPEEAPPPKPTERCPLCHCELGKGAILTNGRIDPCACATAEWRAKLAEVAARDAARAEAEPLEATA
jgi:hypothetical protein